MEIASATTPSRKKSIIKAIVFVVFILIAVALFRFSPVKEVFSLTVLKDFVASSGIWGPLVFIGIYAIGISIFVPGTVLTAAGAVLFGTLYGFIYNEVAAMIGASASFFIGRYLGRDFVASLIGDRLKKYDDNIEKHGFATVLYLRLVFFPFVPMNFGMGLTKVRFSDFFWGTLFGIIAGGFILTFFFATLSDVMISGEWEQLISFKVFFSIALFIFSFFIPKIVKRFKGEL
jgi:uncharacterized membrane protein YdjX (TVP38/TMEM64 family)